MSIQKVGVGLSRQMSTLKTTLRKPQPSCRWSAKSIFSESKPRNIHTYKKLVPENENIEPLIQRIQKAAILGTLSV